MISLIDIIFLYAAETDILGNTKRNVHTGKQHVEETPKMSSTRQNGTEHFPGMIAVIKNYVQVQQNITKWHPDLIAVESPYILRSEFDQIASECRTVLFRTAWRVVRNRETAEDIVQEALRKAYSNLRLGRPYVLPKNRVAPQTSEKAQTERKKKTHKHKKIENIEAWLQVIIRNVAINYVKSRHRQMNDERKLSQLVDVEDTRQGFENPEALILQAEKNKELRDLVATLPPMYASAIQLRFFHEYDYQMIADELHRPLGTIKSSINRGLSMLGETLRGQRAIKNGQMIKHRKAPQTKE